MSRNPKEIELKIHERNPERMYQFLRGLLEKFLKEKWFPEGKSVDAVGGMIPKRISVGNSEMNCRRSLRRIY